MKTKKHLLSTAAAVPTFGRVYGISRQAIVNDDPPTRIPARVNAETGMYEPDLPADAPDTPHIVVGLGSLRDELGREVDLQNHEFYNLDPKRRPVHIRLEVSDHSDASLPPEERDIWCGELFDADGVWCGTVGPWDPYCAAATLEYLARLNALIVLEPEVTATTYEAAYLDPDHSKRAPRAVAVH